MLAEGSSVRTRGDGTVRAEEAGAQGRPPDDEPQAGRCPYLGSASFEQDQAGVFYGLEDLTAALVSRLAGRLSGLGMLVVTGPSGAGNSSLLRAGLLPRGRPRAAGAGIAVATAGPAGSPAPSGLPPKPLTSAWNPTARFFTMGGNLGLAWTVDSHVSPRHNRQRRRGRPELEPAAREPYVPIVDRVEDGWVVRQLAGSATGKTYRCPGCDQEIRPGTAHVVAWPEAGSWAGQASPDDRRHWHTPCWRARGRRR